ncbi:MAG TPA: hypothetical protein VGJ03_15055, partial [Acidimicrobiales bacterium]
MRRSTLRLYAPFIALALVQALIIAVAPSRAPNKTQVAAGANGFHGGSASGGANAGPAVNANPAAAAGSTASGAGGAAADAAGGGDAQGAAAGAGDTSHCAGQYQFDVLLEHGPPCQPKFAGDNGGATSPGVSGDTIKIIYFESQPNEQVNTILGAKGLATTSDQEDAAIKAFTDFINSHYELWGRKISIEKVVGDCPTTPPDYDKCLAAAQEVVKKQPFAVIWVTSLYADVFDVWANAGIISIGGSAFD